MVEEGQKVNVNDRDQRRIFMGIIAFFTFLCWIFSIVSVAGVWGKSKRGGATYSLWKAESCVDLIIFRVCSNVDTKDFSCDETRQHFQASAAFGIIAIFVVTAALAWIVMDLLQRVQGFPSVLQQWGVPIFLGVFNFLTLLHWTIMAGYHDLKPCSSSVPVKSGYKHGPAFAIAVCSWVFSLAMIVLWCVAKFVFKKI